MKNLFEAAVVEEVKERMALLRPDSERQWGKMNPAQTLAHCSAAMEMAVGERTPPRILIGRLLGRFAKKSMIVNEKPMPRNVGTDKSLVVSDERDFHAFAGDVRIGIVCWLMALAMTVIAILWFIRSSRRLRSLRELRLHQSEFRS